MTVRTLLALLLLVAPLQAQQDTLVVRLPVPEQSILYVGDSVFVDVSVDVMTAELAEALGQPLIVNAQPCCQSGGVPGWFYAGTLLVGLAAVLVWSSKEETQIIINNEQSQSQTQSTTTIVKRFPWHKPWRKKGGREEE